MFFTCNLCNPAYKVQLFLQQNIMITLILLYKCELALFRCPKKMPETRFEIQTSSPTISFYLLSAKGVAINKCTRVPVIMGGGGSFNLFSNERAGHSIFSQNGLEFTLFSKNLYAMYFFRSFSCSLQDFRKIFAMSAIVLVLS